ncbi:uncharacterized protein LOC143629634 [Bidens hawaiensis]|uniref:uncharacterized protein LOC143629634 n=1 Tax=Bidens hawaiensis TaxID=980011 RepID=UPI0040492E09
MGDRELGYHAIEYKPRTSFKGQVLDDFITETVPLDDDVPICQEKAKEEPCKKAPEGLEEPLWILYTDGASNEDENGVGLILISPEGIELTYVILLDSSSTNNEAEYKAMLVGLRMAQKIKVRRIKAHVDSLLVANLIKGDHEVKDLK